MNPALRLLDTRGWLADIGQLSAKDKRLLNRLVRQGILVKYRGCWTTGLPATLAPTLGPPHTIYARADDKA